MESFFPAGRTSAMQYLRDQRRRHGRHTQGAATQPLLPAEYLQLGFELIDESRGRIWLSDCAALNERQPRGITSLLTHYPETPGFDALASAVNPQAVVRSIDASDIPGAVHAWELVIDPTADPAIPSDLAGLVTAKDLMELDNTAYRRDYEHSRRYNTMSDTQAGETLPIPFVSGAQPDSGHLEEFNTTPLAFLHRAYQECGEVCEFDLGRFTHGAAGWAQGSRGVLPHTRRQFSAAQAYQMMVPVFGEGIQYGAPPAIERQQLKMQIKGLKHDRMVNYANVVEKEAEDFITAGANPVNSTSTTHLPVLH